jgi:hypothetical protein
MDYYKFSVIGGAGFMSAFMTFTSFKGGYILFAFAWAFLAWHCLKWTWREFVARGEY